MGRGGFPGPKRRAEKFHLLRQEFSPAHGGGHDDADEHVIPAREEPSDAATKQFRKPLKMKILVHGPCPGVGQAESRKATFGGEHGSQTDWNATVVGNQGSVSEVELLDAGGD